MVTNQFLDPTFSKSLKDVEDSLERGRANKKKKITEMEEFVLRVLNQLREAYFPKLRVIPYAYNYLHDGHWIISYSSSDNGNATVTVFLKGEMEGEVYTPKVFSCRLGDEYLFPCVECPPTETDLVETFKVLVLKYPEILRWYRESSNR